MCGIVGQHGSPDPSVGQRMLERIGHRGPDGEGSIRVNGSWLGHCRLSIVDVEGGDQPLTNHPEDLWLVGNGEIYNHDRVRQDLGERLFATSSDNEVLVHLLEERGPEGLADIRGMYAFCAAGEDGRFYAARDPVGIKPLYWARRDGEVRFASEMRAFDPDWLADVQSFPPGHYWSPDTGLTRFAQAVVEDIEQREGPDEPGSELPDQLLAETREVLVEAIDFKLMSDVPVGVFLSGGLDSSVVAAVAADKLREQGMTLQTFAVGLEGSPDLEAARAVADHLGTEHHERTYTPQEAIEVTPEVVRTIESFDPSLVRSAVPNYLLAELAARHVKVVLTGEGADEIFAGYDYLREHQDDEAQLEAEIRRIIAGLHDLNLQRCDRATMAHGLEARVPFLEQKVIAFGLSLPAGWKFAGPDQPEKRILREAFDGWLPDEILWRKKEQFGDGSGASTVLTEHAEQAISDADFATGRDEVTPPLRSKEELYYWRILRDELPGLRPEQTIGRFATT